MQVETRTERATGTLMTRRSQRARSLDAGRDGPRCRSDHYADHHVAAEPVSLERRQLVQNGVWCPRGCDVPRWLTESEDDCGSAGHAGLGSGNEVTRSISRPESRARRVNAVGARLPFAICY